MRATAVTVLLLLAIASPALAGRTRLQQHQRHHRSGSTTTSTRQANPQTHTLGNPTPPAVCVRPKDKFEQLHYTVENPVANYKQDCSQADNMPCTKYGLDTVNDKTAPKTGCALYAKAIHICSSSAAKVACPAGVGFAYSGDYKGCDHVITIAKDPIRGLEDVWQTGDSLVRTHWKTFWSDSVAGNSGHDGNSGFDADTGALVINPAAHREYHQLHIHGGAWRTKQFDACLNAQPAALKTGTWYTARCRGLSEGGAGQPPLADAFLAYQVIDKSNLDTAWDLWREAVKTKVEVRTKASDPNTKISPNEAAFFSALLVTRRSTNKLPANQVIVAAYWPSTTDADDGLGRGHFVMKGKPGTTGC